MTDDLEVRLVDLLAQPVHVDYGPELLARVMLRRAQLARRHRRRRLAVALAAAVVLAAAVQTAYAGRGSTKLDPVTPTMTGVAHVGCTQTSTTLGSPTVATQHDGVHFQVTAAGASGVYLNVFTPPGGPFFGGGDPVPADNREIVEPIPPGPVDLDCSTASFQSTPRRVRLTVVDPAGYWNPTTLSEALGCTPNAQASTRNVGHSRTERDAVEALLSGDETTKPFSGGYPAASVKVWLVFKGGKGHASVQVSHDAAGYQAGFDQLCVTP